jgi:O-antigen/teichoic acid export membrane protein
LTASQLATWSATAVVVAVLPRKLDAADYGVFQFASVFVGYFALVALLGTNTFLVKAVARDPGSVGRYVCNAVALKFVLSAVLTAFALGASWALGYPTRTVALVAVACILMLTNVINDTFAAALQGLEQMGQMALWRVLQTYVAVGASLFVLLSGHGIVAYAVVAPICAVVPLVANGWHLWPHVRQALGIDTRIWRELTVGGMPFMAWSAILVLYGTIDIPLLRALAGDAAVGSYSLAYAWVGMPAGFSSIVTSAIMPSLSANAARQSMTEFARLANRAITLVVFVAFPASLGIALVAPDVFRLLHYRAGFEHAVPLIQILAIHIPIVGLDMVLGTVLFAVDRQNKWILVGAAAALLNPLLNVVAIPFAVRRIGSGGVGAAGVTVVTELFMLGFALVIRPRGVMDRGTVSFVARCGAATVAMVPVLLALGHAPLPVKVVSGALAYGVASVVAGTVSPTALSGWRRGQFAPGRLLTSMAVSGD